MRELEVEIFPGSFKQSEVLWKPCDPEPRQAVLAGSGGLALTSNLEVDLSQPEAI